MQKRNLKVIRAYEQGMSLRLIGEKFGISRQRVWQIIKIYSSRVKIDTSKRKKRHNTASNPRKSEVFVANKLRSIGCEDIRHQPYNSYFDILCDGKTIEVKHHQKISIQYGRKYYMFPRLYGIKKADYYILITGRINNPKSYIFKGEEVLFNAKSIPVHPKNDTIGNRMLASNLENWKRIKLGT